MHCNKSECSNWNESLNTSKCFYRNRKTTNGGSVIGDNCDIGAGAKIIGVIKICNNVSIVVLTDVQDNAKAV